MLMEKIIAEINNLRTKLKKSRVFLDVKLSEKYLGNALLWGSGLIIFCSIVMRECSFLLLQGGIVLQGFQVIIRLFVRGWFFLGAVYIFVLGMALLCGVETIWKRGIIISILSVWSIYKIRKYGEITFFSAAASSAQMIGVLLAVYYAGFFGSKKVGKSEKNLKNCRRDKIYIDLLVESIRSKDLKSRIANETYTYIYGSDKYKRIYKSLVFLSILLPALIAMMNGNAFFKGDTNKLVIALLSMLSVIVTGVLGSAKAKESWVRYREYAERAKREIFLAVMQIGEYSSLSDCEEKEKKLAEELEKLYLEESGRWRELRSLQNKSS